MTADLLRELHATSAQLQKTYLLAKSLGQSELAESLQLCAIEITTQLGKLVVGIKKKAS